MNSRSSNEMSKEDADLIDSWLLILLAINDNETIRGKIKITKEYFLIARELIPNLLQVSEFYPYHFGPYSTRLANRINTLAREGIITVQQVNSDINFTLSKEGESNANKILKSIDKKLISAISTIKQSYRKKSVNSILKDVYKKYPEYAGRSIVAKELMTKRFVQHELVDDGPNFVAPSHSSEEEIVIKKEIAKELFNILSEWEKKMVWLEYLVEKFNLGHLQYEFKSNDLEVDEFYENCLSYIDEQNSAVYVLLDIEKKNILAFFVISMNSIRAEVDNKVIRWPTGLIGQLGVNEKFQKQGVGTDALNEAIKKIYELSDDIGCRLVLVQTYNYELVKKKNGKDGFYLKNHFVLINQQAIKSKNLNRYDLIFDLKRHFEVQNLNQI